MLPPAPARFSTTICWPSCSPSTGWRMRAVVSVPPPGSKPTTMVTGLFGYCAKHIPETSNAPIVRPILLITPLLLYVVCRSLLHCTRARAGSRPYARRPPASARPPSPPCATASPVEQAHQTYPVWDVVLLSRRRGGAPA